MNLIDVQVGTQFYADCDCGWSLQTRDEGELESKVKDHADESGHIWPKSAEEEDRLRSL